MNIPNDPEKIAGFVRSRVAEAERDAETRIVKTSTHEGFYAGTSWVRYNSNNGTMFFDEQVFNGVKQNWVRYCIDTALATMTGREFRPEVFPVTRTPASNRGARAGNMILNQTFRQNGGMAGVKRFVKNLLVRGNNFKKAEVDLRGLNTVVMDPMELQEIEQRGVRILPGSVRDYDSGRKTALIQSPRIVEREVHPNCVGVPSGLTDFEEADWFTVTSYQSIEKVRDIAQRLGPNAEAVKSVDIVDIRRPNEGGYWRMPLWQAPTRQTKFDNQEAYTYSIDSGLSKLTEFWHRDSSGAWWVIYCANNNCDAYLGYEGPFAMHPYVHFGMWNVPSLFWCMSHQEDLIQPNTMLNKFLTLEVDWFERAVKNVWIVPRDSALVGVDDSFGDYMLSYSGQGAGIQYLQVSNDVMIQLGAKANRILQSMMELARISEVSRGIIPDRTSTETVAMALNQDSTTLEAAMSGIKQSYSMLWSKELHYLRSSGAFDLPTLIAQVGQQNALGVAEFRDTDLAGDFYMEAKAGPPRLETAREVMENAAVLWQHGLFADGFDAARQRFQDYVTTGEMPYESNEIKQSAEAEAQIENEKFNQEKYGAGLVMVTTVQNPNPAPGEQPMQQVVVDTQTGLPLFQFWQDHAAHIAEHSRFIQDISTSPISRQLALIHRLSHEQAVQQQQAFMQQQIMEQESQKSLADAAGNIQNTIVAAEVDPGKGDAKKSPSTPRQGGINSGKAREGGTGN